MRDFQETGEEGGNTEKEKLINTGRKEEEIQQEEELGKERVVERGIHKGWLVYAKGTEGRQRRQEMGYMKEENDLKTERRNEKDEMEAEILLQKGAYGEGRRANGTGEEPKQGTGGRKLEEQLFVSSQEG